MWHRHALHEAVSALTAAGCSWLSNDNTPMARSSASSQRKAHDAPSSARPAAGGRHQVRIVGGQWRSRLLPVADKPGLRPTPDRVRETLFTWLGQDLSGWRCVDAFAGSGALGFEAASRGAADVLMVERDPALVAALNAARTQLDAKAVRVQRGDGLAALQQLAPGSVDLALLDPPFDSEVFAPAVRAAARAVGADGHVYLEAPRVWSGDELLEFGLTVKRHLKAGAVHAHWLRRVEG